MFVKILIITTSFLFAIKFVLNQKTPPNIMKAEPDKTDKNMITIINIVIMNNITLKKQNSITRAMFDAISMANKNDNEPTLVLNNVDKIVLYLLCFLSILVVLSFVYTILYF